MKPIHGLIYLVSPGIAAPGQAVEKEMKNGSD